MRIGGGAHVVPIEHVLAERVIPVGGLGVECSPLESVRRRVGIGEERRLAVAPVARPPTHLHLLCVPCVSRDEVVGGRLGREAGEEADGEIEGAPPGVDWRRAAAVRSAEGGEDEGGLGGRGEVGGNLLRLIGGVLAVLVERDAPGDLLRSRVDRDRTAELGDGGEQLPRHLAHRPVRSERDAPRAPVAVLGPRLVAVQVESHDQRPRAVGRRQRRRLPPPRGQPQRGVLQLRLGRSELRRQLAQRLGVGVKRVAGCRPVLIGSTRPGRRLHRTKIAPGSRWWSKRNLTISSHRKFSHGSPTSCAVTSLRRRSTHAPDQQLLWDHDLDVLRRDPASRPAAFPCPVRRG